jgi:hypothetical protein
MEDTTEFLTLAKIILLKKLEHAVGQRLGIKGESVRRELNRILAYYCEPLSTKQKRSGRKKWNIYKCAMCEVVKINIRRYCFKEIQTRRTIAFGTLEETLAYTAPIYYICCITWDYIGNFWNVYIPEHSDGIEQCLEC